MLDTKLTYEDMAKIGTILGSASVIVMDETVDIDLGRREGDQVLQARKLRQMHALPRRHLLARQGAGSHHERARRKETDIDLINNIAKNMQGVTLCALGDFAANPIIETIKNFPEDFKAHIAAKAPEPRSRGEGCAGARRGSADAERPLLPETNLARRATTISSESGMTLTQSPSLLAALPRGCFRGTERWHNLNWAIAAYPDVAANYVLRGELLLKQGDTLGAISDFRRALELAAEQVETEDWGVVAQAVQDRALAGLRDALHRAARYNSIPSAMT